MSPDYAGDQLRNELTGYFMSHGIIDAAMAQHKAIVALGDIVRRQAMVIAYADTLAVLGFCSC
jgi:DHA2 family multidrug resistance protein